MMKQKNYLENLESKLLKLVRQIGRTADQEGLNVYVVGGVVRDLMLKRKNLDLDIVVEGRASRLAKQWAKTNKGDVIVHDRFGTATVQLKGGQRIDFATARSERYPSPGVLPVVREGSIEDDLFRRDFSINSMAIQINRVHFGQLVDKFEGKKDLKKKKVRILHRQSFVDDPTRILRAVRFEQRFRFALDRFTLSLLKKALRGGFPNRVKPERYFAEFKKVLSEPKPKKSLKRLHALDGLKFLGCRGKVSFPFLTRLEDALASLQRKGLGKGVEQWLIYFMAITAQEKSEAVQKMLVRFNLNRQDRKKVLSIQNSKALIHGLSQANKKASELYKDLKPLSLEAMFFIYAQTKSDKVRKNITRFMSQYHSVSLCINGDDLKELGIAQSRAVGTILQKVLYQKLDGRLCTRAQELRAARQLIKT